MKLDRLSTRALRVVLEWVEEAFASESDGIVGVNPDRPFEYAWRAGRMSALQLQRELIKQLIRRREVNERQ